MQHRQRVISFIDGLNLYHAIAILNRPELKWTDLRALSKVFIKSYSEELTKVFYFSAYADHVPIITQQSQQAYILALKLRAVTPILGHFKKKTRICPSCTHKWFGHEEKETDVNIALFLLDLAYQDAFDRALVISNDSDLAPAIRMVRQRFPQKRITTVSPHYYHSIELINASSDKTKIRIEHLERCCLPPVVADPSGLVSVSRPHEYLPNSRTYATIK
ncbi:MAG: NYN domain-containing protein [Verrucomicrobia bacterium]|nr:NYN domain-containing protein [Verrucomicrobiota bacterium]